jgi:long-chain-fatty-acid--[acyl-carrier-protein] ligase
VRRVVEFFIRWTVRLALSLRYRVKVKGLETLNDKNLTRPGGILFLPNHSAIFVDPTLIVHYIWRKFRPRPMIVEYFYYTPIVNTVMQYMRALPVPNFDTSTNSLKRKRNDHVFQTAIRDIRNGDNFLIYPAGRLKSAGRETIGGASGVHRILKECPQVNVVLVHIDGLWGSSFSRAWIGKSPDFFSTVWEGVKVVFKNLIFFTPRRTITIEYRPAPADFPFHASRIELNKWLERWYNHRWDPRDTGELGEPFQLVPYSMWNRRVPDVEEYQIKFDQVDVSGVDPKVRNKVLHFLARLTERDPDSITPNMALATDLGLDSLDASEIIVFLEDQYNVMGLQPADLTTVGQIIGLAAGVVGQAEQVDEDTPDLKAWRSDKNRTGAFVPEGETIPEVFLRRCDMNPKQVACADGRSGILTYRKLKIRALLLASYLKRLPGTRIGVMLPSSVAANVVILAAQLAGKTPVMINWTVGPRHFKAVIQATGVEKIITAWGFVDRLRNVDLSGTEDLMLMLEDLARDIGIKDKLAAVRNAFRPVDKILRLYGADRLSTEDPAVILFTSGTESTPKGVPLSHKNIISNQRAAVPAVKLNPYDVMLATLPPFHSFGFSITGLLPILAGVKVAYSPDPTEAKRLARAIEKWGATLYCSAPTFLKGVLRSGTAEQLKSVRLFVSGAEKAPQELRDRVKELGEEKELLEGYGITECAPILTFNKPGEEPKGVGQPIPGVELLVIHPDTHEELSQGQRGLVLARGPNVFGGYLNGVGRDPFMEMKGHRWYNTGDLGFIDTESNLNLVGRLKRFIKIGGEMLSLSSIEEALYQQASSQGWSLGEEGPSLAVCSTEEAGERPRIYLFTRFETTVEEVNSSLRSAGFSNLVKVGAVKKLPDIPVLGSGKINYRQLESSHCT